MDSLITKDEHTNIIIDMPDLNNLIKWATFTAIMEIVFGALTCLGIITAVFGIPLIISGVRLLAAVDEMKKYMAKKDLKSISKTFIKMNGYFKLKGTAIIILIIFAILAIILYWLLAFYLISKVSGTI